MLLVLWQAQHITHLEMVFVYAAAPADIPTPIQSQQSRFISVYQSREARMVRGGPASGISGPTAGGRHTTCIHMNRHYCHNQLMGSHWLEHVWPVHPKQRHMYT